MIRNIFKNSDGVSVLLFLICLLVFCVFTALTVDIGLGIYTKRQMQLASDAASLAGVYELIEGPNVISAINMTRDVGVLNKLFNSELSKVGAISIGNWSFEHKEFISGYSPYNAVRVYVTRTIPSYFSRVIGVDTLSLQSESIAVIEGASSASCLIPFAVTSVTVENVNYNQILTVGTENSGNWGKLQIGDENLNSSPNFIEAILSGVCQPAVSVGDHIPPATGFAGIENAFEQRIQSNPYVIMPVVDSFPNGNSGTTIIQGFIYAELLSIDRRGNNWTLNFKPINGLSNGQVGGPDGSPYVKARILVK